jgi:YaiO family outer membrane protein
MSASKKNKILKIRTFFIAAFVIIFFFLDLSGNFVYSQEMNLTELFRQARQLAYDNKTEEARKLCYKILSEKPDYHDSRVLLARTFIWDNRYDTARKELKRVYQTNPRYYDCLHALADLERWTGHYSRALEHVNEALNYYPDDEEFLYKKAEILSHLENNKLALVTLDSLLRIQPSHKKGNVLYHELDTGLFKKAGLLHRFYFFKKPWIKRWHIVSARTDINLNNWPVTGMVNFGKMAGANPLTKETNNINLQFQLDGYPRFTPSDYGYFNMAYSPSLFFPEIRFGAEWFHTFNKGVELSLGLRGMKWDKIKLYYTGSLGWYYQSYWFSFRTYFTPQEEIDAYTYMARVRKYLATSKDYIGISFQYGISPESPAYVTDFTEINKLNNTGIYLEYQENIRDWIFKVGLNYRYEEYMKSKFRNHIGTELHILYQL